MIQLSHPGCAARPWALECNRFAVKHRGTPKRAICAIGIFVTILILLTGCDWDEARMERMAKKAMTQFMVVMDLTQSMAKKATTLLMAAAEMTL